MVDRRDQERPEPLRFVRKRDGRVVGFDRGKISDAVRRATSAAGEEDAAFADDVAAVVEMALARGAGRQANGDEHRMGSDGPPVPEIEAIQDCVERALIELGRAAVAKAYILYRDRRARAREALRVRPPTNAAHDVEVLEADRTAAWSKSRIAAALVTEAELPRDVAETVATRVEERVFAAGLESISTSLIRALVDNELVDLGLTAALERQEPVSLPRHDLRLLFGGEGERCWSPWLDLRERGDTGPPEALERSDLERALAGEALRRFALRDVLDARGRELHLGGDMHVEDLRSPHLYLTLGIPAELAAAGSAGSDGPFGLLASLPSLLASTARGIALEDTGALLGDLARATRPRSPLGLGGWLRAVAAVAEASGRRVDVHSPGTRHAAARARLLEEWVELDQAPLSPRLLLDESEVAELAASSSGERARLLRLLESGRAVATFGREGEQFAAPGCRRQARERGLVACGGAVAINLPRLARAAGPWREERMMEDLFGLLSCAVETCRALQRFQNSAASARPLTLRPRVGYALVPVGLREALRVLGDGQVDAEQGARLLGLMVEAASRFPGPGAPAMVVSPFFGERARLRLFGLDVERSGAPGVRQGLLFDGAADVPGADWAEGAGRRPYGLGYALAVRGRLRPGEGEAELMRTLPSGALYPALPASVDEPTAHDRFLAARERQRGVDPGELLPLEGERARLRLLGDDERLAEVVAAVSGARDNDATKVAPSSVGIEQAKTEDPREDR
ncbi:ATP cone domain-containing protein [Engelhardtia mirabilis]|uniref:Ribonucleoside-diphosphate reductase NrdZ n=1 Tax=Engelhardtia mirabilis TaxID=2528011 RepID=A0A518BJB0_9BACT|nr:Ribonucleoside-diphosphate reductase NrdZ [Planctomycetes bacterium Pla133]QDV01394.1 Ribonucleoside-diphosphate reductase NrdZ [Planctomycetes bacterium Pla86]